MEFFSIYLKIRIYEQDWLKGKQWKRKSEKAYEISRKMVLLCEKLSSYSSYNHLSC